MRRILTIACVCVGILMPGLAQASPIALVILDSLGHSSGVIIDGDLLDANPADGVVAFNGGVGDWTLNLTSGARAGSGLSLNSINASAATSSTLFVLFTSLGHTAITDYLLGFDVALQNGSAAYGVFADPANAGFGLTLGIGSVGPFVAGPGAMSLFTGSAFGPGPPAGPYSLTQLFVVQGAGEGVTIFTGQATVTAVPEPATFVLLGTGLAAALITRRLRGRAR